MQKEWVQVVAERDMTLGVDTRRPNMVGPVYYIQTGVFNKLMFQQSALCKTSTYWTSLFYML